MSVRVIVVASVFKVTVPPAPPTPSVFAALPVVVMSALVEIDIVPPLL